MKFPKYTFLYLQLVIFSVTLMLHFRFLHLDIVGQHSWRQTETQSTIHHFAETDFNIFNPRTFYIYDDTEIHRKEFPLLQWITGGIFRITGTNLFLERFLFLIIGFIACLGMGKTAELIFKNKGAGIMAIWAFCFSPLLYYYTINPLPDLLALCFACWGMAFFFKWQNNQNWFTLLSTVLLFSLAALCKLPFVLFFALFGGWLWNEWRQKKLNFIFTARVVFISVSALIFPAAWYYMAIQSWNNNMITSGMLNNSLSASQILDIITGTIVSTLPEFLLNYAAVPFFIAGIIFFFRNKTWKNKNFMPLLFLLIALTAYYLFEINAITLVHDYYLMPFLPLLFIIVVHGFWQTIGIRHRLIYLSLILLVAMPVAASLRVNSRWDEKDPGFNRDWLVYRDALRNTIPPDAKIITGNDFSGHISHYYTLRYGWSFYDDQIDPVFFAGYVKKGATYLVSDSRKLETNERILPFIGEKLASFGSINIFKLNNPSAAGAISLLTKQHEPR